MKLNISKIKSWEKPSKIEKAKRTATDKIQAAFQNENSVVVMPAHTIIESNSGKRRRVAAYCRVSTDEENQISSYELQINYYREYIERNPEWELAGIYADRGLSGTAKNNRVGLLQMIEDCHSGKIDHIITKSVSRFSRNVRDCLSIIDELLALTPPVAVDFETDNINSARDRFETELFFSAFIAQSESIKKSRVIKWAWQIRFSKGLALMPTHCILGYDRDPCGNIVIVPKEAKIIRFIYSSYLEGQFAFQISAALTKAKIPTVKGLSVWSADAVLRILRSEKYVGDALMQKTYTPDCLSHKSVKNKGQVTQYYKKNHHSAIIQRSDWDEVQCQLNLRKYMRPKKPKATLPIQRIKCGILKDFIVIPKLLGERKLQEFIAQIENERGI